MCVDYGRIRAARDIDLRVGPSERVALIGANGAGKSTCLKALCGLLPIAAGDALYDGASIRSLAPHQLARRGVSIVPEGRGVFGRLTAMENLEAGAYLRADRAEVAREIEGLLGRFPMLRKRLKEPAGVLSGGEQQALVLGRALLSRPRLLLLDEPSMGLAPLMVEMVFSVLRDLGRNMAVLLVEQNSFLALEFCDRAYVLESGAVAAEGSPGELWGDETIKELYLGGGA
jgi:branched-chain amino acid transport system ATP-binding protein